MSHRTSLPDKLFVFFNYTFFILIGIATIFPFLNIIAKSLSSEAAVISGMVTIFPVDFQIGTYEYVISDKMFQTAFRNSVLITIMGTFLGLLMTTLVAYPLSKPRLRFRKFFILMFLFTWLFSGGLIPTYLLMRELGLINTMAILFVPSAVNVYNMLIIKSYFEGIPDEIEESAKMDGAGNIRVLFQIFLPVSLPVLATIALFFAVGFWNDFFAAMIYINSPALKPLQLYLKELLASANDVFLQLDMIDVNRAMNASPESIQAASIMVATVPILLVYPFLQKYFVKGVMLGSVKG